ncbi:hypothetical protein [Candidatus Poriferisocius sp.]|uniref:hypothetical protein n=1 Tax=Candidatus Poriferisocius sp. TaxID=3101276 RepID=UPI003B5C6CF8
MTSRKVHYFELITDDSVDLLDDAVFDALHKAGCDDALVGHHRLDFAREAETLSEALKSAKSDAESVPGVRVLSVNIDSAEIHNQDKHRTTRV